MFLFLNARRILCKVALCISDYESRLLSFTLVIFPPKSQQSNT